MNEPPTMVTGRDPVDAAPSTGGTDVVQEANVVNPRDRVRWGPIVAGLLTALGIRDAALPAFLGLALPALAATLGGFLGARDELDPRSRRWIPD